MGRRRQASIGFRLGLLVAAMTFGVMAAIVASISYYEYREQLEHIEAVSRRIEDTVVPQLAAAVAAGDLEGAHQLVADLPGNRHLSYAEFAVGRDTLRAGLRLTGDAMPHTFAVNGAAGPGELRIQFGRASIHRAFLHHTRVETTLVLGLVLVLALATMLLFRRLVTRHLDALAEYARSLSFETLDREFRFARRPRANPDELDRLHASVDSMRHNLMQEIGNRREAEQRMHQMERMEVVGRLASGIAHDFNNLLAGIMGSAEAVVRDARSTSVRKYGEMIVATARRAADLTGRLLSFSRQAPTAIAPRDLHEIVRDVCAILERSMDKKITLVTELTADHPVVTADQAMIQSAILNLGLNARDAMPEGGVLTIRTALVRAEGAAGDQVELSVSDTGAGIAREMHDSVFEPFFTTKSAGKGTGLGLASVAATIREHGGTIDFDSEEGRGSVFRIRLPLATGSADPATRNGLEVVRGSGLVLVVDDENTVRSTLCQSLTELGYRVICAEDGAAGLATYRRHAAEIDVVILDMIMPKLDGAQTFTAIREVDPDARIVIATGYSDNAALDDLVARGANGMLRKPFLFAELSQVVAQAAAR